MNPILKNVLAVVAGLLIGLSVNMALIMISGSIIPPPEGSDLTTNEGLLEAMKIMEPKHFIMPFLAHALGTLAGAFVIAKIAASYKLVFSLAIGALFLYGGIIMVQSLPSSVWFNVLDLVVAYIPMAFLGWKLGSKKAVSAN